MGGVVLTAKKKRGLKGWIIQPMRFTGRELGRAIIHRPETVLYPLEKERDKWEALRENFRGQHEVDWIKCIGCKLCSKVCPNQCITMEDIKVEENYKGPSRSHLADRKNILHRPGVDIGRCLFCGNCGEYCPTDAWTQTTLVELTVFERDALIYSAEQVKTEGEPSKKLVNKIEENPRLDVETCIGCRRCYNECPTKCIEMIPGPKMRKDKPIEIPEFDYSKCIGCSTCCEVCKPKSLTMEEI
ncbi:MAG: 4Fe-4S dicluster domain-containing protein [Thermoplasmata archaeon]